jgi:hypothetical protein
VVEDDWLSLLLLEQPAMAKVIAAAADRAKNFFSTVRFFILFSSKFKIKVADDRRSCQDRRGGKAIKKALVPTHGTKAAASAIPPKLTFPRPLAYAYHHTRPDG